MHRSGSRYTTIPSHEYGLDTLQCVVVNWEYIHYNS